jgi:hypothetical protein
MACRVVINPSKKQPRLRRKSLPYARWVRGQLLIRLLPLSRPLFDQPGAARYAPHPANKDALD